MLWVVVRFVVLPTGAALPTPFWIDLLLSFVLPALVLVLCINPRALQPSLWRSRQP
jgi:hypothetical protein